MAELHTEFVAEAIKIILPTAPDGTQKDFQLRMTLKGWAINRLISQASADLHPFLIS